MGYPIISRWGLNGYQRLLFACVAEVSCTSRSEFVAGTDVLEGARAGRGAAPRWLNTRLPTIGSLAHGLDAVHS